MVYSVALDNRYFFLVNPSSGIRLSGYIRNPVYGSWRLLEFIPEAVLRRHMVDDAIPPLFRSKRGG